MSKQNANRLKDRGYLLGRNIQRIRQRRGLTQERFAEEVGITQNYLGIIEVGLKIPSMKVLMTMADVLEVKTRDLIPF